MSHTYNDTDDYLGPTACRNTLKVLDTVVAASSHWILGKFWPKSWFVLKHVTISIAETFKWSLRILSVVRCWNSPPSTNSEQLCTFSGRSQGSFCCLILFLVFWADSWTTSSKFFMQSANLWQVSSTPMSRSL